MTPEQHEQFSAACTAFGDALEKIFKTEAPTMERQEHNHINDALNYQQGKRDWEILEFGHLRSYHPWTIQHSTGEYCLAGAGKIYTMSLDQLFESGLPIRSVRRLSDNTVWTVGDNTSRGVIKKFTVNDGTLFVYGDDWNTLIRTLMKPDPLFTTADGVQVFDKAQTVYALFWPSGTISEIGARFVLAEWMIYSTREAAEKAYDEWLYTRPVLSIWDFDGCSETGDALTARLKQLVKDKIVKR